MENFWVLPVEKLIIGIKDEKNFNLNELTAAISDAL